VSESGFHAWRGRPTNYGEDSDQTLAERLVKALSNSWFTYGVRRLTDEIRDQGDLVNHKRVARVKRKYGIYPRIPKAFVITTDSDHDLPIAENHLNREFSVDGPNQVWVSDITYLRGVGHWWFLAVIIDLFSRRVVGWSVANHMRAELVCSALDQAIAHRGTLPKMFHSDRGSQYASEVLKDMLRDSDVTQSMSRRANCWDNAVAESFFGRLKSECIGDLCFETEKQVRQHIFEYIEVFYNRKRRHSYLNNKSPHDFESEMTFH